MCLPAQAATATATAKTSKLLEVACHGLLIVDAKQLQRAKLFPSKKEEIPRCHFLQSFSIFLSFLICCAGAKCNIRSVRAPKVQSSGGFWVQSAPSMMRVSPARHPTHRRSDGNSSHLTMKKFKGMQKTRMLIIRLFGSIHDSTGCNLAGASSIHPLISISFYSFLFQDVWYRFS